MNKIEKIVYDAVKGNPRIKLFIRNTYQNLMDLLPDKPNFSAAPITLREGFFWGFHDLSPVAPDGRHVLGCKLEIPLRMPRPDDPLTIGWWDGDLSTFTPAGTSLAWGYHKGCRLQWMGKSSVRFIFNTCSEDRLCAQILSTDGSDNHIVPYPIDTVSPDGRMATTFSYRRLNEMMPGYGYNIEDDSMLDQPAPADTGLFLLDLSTGARRLLFSLEQLAAMQPDKTMTGARHFVTHTEFSPDGQRIIFMHRWRHNDPEKRFSRLMTCRLDGSDLHISPTSGMVSHYVWDSRWGILAYCQVNGTDGHYLFSDHTMGTYRRVAPTLNSDGHQSFVPGTPFFITDTYPDSRRYAKLYLVNLDTDEATLIADLKSPKRFQSPDSYRNWCCDLHPRVSPDGRQVSFDSVHTGTRALCFMPLTTNLQAANK